jgi:hypothetical protein
MWASAPTPIGMVRQCKAIGAGRRQWSARLCPKMSGTGALLTSIDEPNLIAVTGVVSVLDSALMQKNIYALSKDTLF